MIADERRRQILRIAESQGYVSLQQLTAETGASESTVRRDLELLDSQGQLRRTRGGAAYAGDSLTDFDVRVRQASTEKQLIAQRTAELIQDGETVLLDGGTTTLEVARRLQGRSLQVVTNSLPIASLLVNQPTIELIMIGGYLYPKTGVALGVHAVATLQSISVSRLVMSAGGVTEDGLFNSNALLVETEQQMIRVAQNVTLVCDSSKFGRPALSVICPLDAVDDIVTDSGLSEGWRQRLADNGVRLHMADIPQTPVAESARSLTAVRKSDKPVRDKRR